MTPFNQMTKRLTDLREEEAMHLFDTDAKEEKALCGADASAEDLMTVQCCLRQLIKRIPVGNVCRTCMGFAGGWA